MAATLPGRKSNGYFEGLVVGRIVHYHPQGTGVSLAGLGFPEITQLCVPAIVTFVHRQKTPPLFLNYNVTKDAVMTLNVIELDIRWPENIVTAGPFETGRAVKYGEDFGMWHWPSAACEK